MYAPVDPTRPGSHYALNKMEPASPVDAVAKEYTFKGTSGTYSGLPPDIITKPFWQWCKTDYNKVITRSPHWW